jgi:lipoprotein-anchoring transpeptidase ErfK/SrfK
MRRICMTALLVSAFSGSAFADPLQVTVYPYGNQPVYVAQQPAAQQYYAYAPQPRYLAAPAGYGQPYGQSYPQNYAPQNFAVAAPQSYAAPAPQAYAAAAPPTYAQQAPQTQSPQSYVQPAPQTYVQPVAQTYAQPLAQTYAAAAPAPAPANPGGGGFLQAIFGGPTINVPVSHIYPGYQAPQQVPQAQPQAVAPAQQQAYAPANPPDESNYPINPQFMRQVVAYNGDEKPGTIIVDTPDKFLFLVEDGGRALRYGIGVGRPGFTWSGVKTITAMKKWPDWTPPPEMIARQPGIPHFMAGGIGNPLGARAMYLGSTLYRIHGSNEPWTIGQNVSSGCIRMRNEDVEDLYNRVKIGTKVVII